MKHIRCSTYLRDNFQVDSVELLIKCDFSGEKLRNGCLQTRRNYNVHVLITLEIPWSRYSTVAYVYTYSAVVFKEVRERHVKN